MKKVLLIGASSGIGKDMAVELDSRGYQLCIAARRKEKLEELNQQLTKKALIVSMDSGLHKETRIQLEQIIKNFGGVDIVIYNAGIGDSSKNWDIENQSIQVNAVGFANVANFFFDYFKTNKIKGQIVGISSVASRRGSRMAIAYSATKAFMSNYMEGQRQESLRKGLGITITDIRPGFIDTPMTAGQKGMFWVSSSVKASKQIIDAIEQKKSVAYITKRWIIAAWLMSNLPDFIWNRQ